MMKSAIVIINGAVYHRSVLNVRKLRALGLSDTEIKKLGFEIEKKEKSKPKDEVKDEAEKEPEVKSKRTLKIEKKSRKK